MVLTDRIGIRRIEIFTQLLQLFRPGRLVDLGAGHGLFSIEAAKAGWEVTAVDARTERNTSAPGVQWVESDVRSFSLEGFDLIACLGLFYHLTIEDQMDLLRRCRGTPIIIDTHLANGRSRHRLSERVELCGFAGGVYEEVDGLGSSWGNVKSFWPTPESFYQMLDDAGYGVVAAVEPWYLSDRTFFVGLPGSVNHGAGRSRLIAESTDPLPKARPSHAIREPSRGISLDDRLPQTSTALTGLCLACGQVVEEWGPGPGGRPSASCPHCFSLERHRFLSLLLHALSSELKKGAVLDVAPMEPITRLLREQTGGLYVGIDVDPSADRRTVQVTADLTDLPFSSESFHAIICYHVLEHVKDDRKAMAELARVLSPGGLALIQVPWRPGQPTDEDPGALKEERVQRFGQADHVRYYGDDFVERLQAAGFATSRLTPEDVLENEVIRRAGLIAGESVWIVTQHGSVQDRSSADTIEMITRRLSTAIVTAWTRGAQAAASSIANLEQSQARLAHEGERAVAAMEEAEKRASEWEKAYWRLRFRWPVRVMARTAKLGHRVVGRQSQKSRSTPRDD